MKFITFLFVMLLSPSMAMAALQPSDFAFGMPLTLDKNGAVYRLTIPQDVYETVVRNDLGDLRVFNGANAVVPHVLRRPEAQTNLSEVSDTLPIFPFYDTGSSENPDGFSVRIEKDKYGAIINVDSDVDGGDAEKRCSGYLINLGDKVIRIDALDLSWPEASEDFVTAASVEYSEDLTHWKTLVPRATIVKMAFGGHEINRHRIELGPNNMFISPRRGIRPKGMSTDVPMVSGYLRLRWESGGEAVDVTEIKAVRRVGEKVEMERIWTPVRGVYDGRNSESNRAVYEYDSAARFPANKVRLGFAEKNTLVNASIFSRTDDDAPWRYRQGGIFYNLEIDESSLVQDTISVGPVSDRFWRVEIFDVASADSGSIPVLELGWTPYELLFVARGEGPFVLAYGSARLGEEAPSGNFPALLSNLMKEDTDGLLKTAAPGEKIELGGAGQLVPEPPPLPWKKWLLWGMLVIGVVIIAWMAISLIKGIAK